MTKWFIMVLLWHLFLGCKAQDQNSSDNNSYMEPMPFTIERENVRVNLPESLGENNVNGFSVVSLELDKSGSILNVSLTKLIVKDKRGSVKTNYLNEGKKVESVDEYPQDVRKYASFFKDYAKTLEIIRNQAVKPADTNDLSILIRF